MAKIDIINKAINLLGEAYVNSPTQATKAASRANQEYDQVRDAVLRAHTWNFATKRRQLSASAETPVYGWTHAFPVPSDYIRMHSVSDTNADYVGEEGPEWEIGLHGASDLRSVFMNSETCYIKYIKRVTNENLFDPLFIEAFAQKLSAEVCYSLTQDRGLYKDMLAIYSSSLKRAKSIDSQEGNYVEVIDDAWLSAKHGRPEPPMRS